MLVKGAQGNFSTDSTGNWQHIPVTKLAIKDSTNRVTSTGGFMGPLKITQCWVHLWEVCLPPKTTTSSATNNSIQLGMKPMKTGLAIKRYHQSQGYLKLTASNYKECVFFDDLNYHMIPPILFADLLVILEITYDYKNFIHLLKEIHLKWFSAKLQLCCSCMNVLE